jgi:hypothetical protein
MGFLKKQFKKIKSNPLRAVPVIGIPLAGADFLTEELDIFGAQAQIDALKEAGRLEEAARLENKMFQERLLRETAFAREAAQRATGQLEAEVQAPIGESPLFQRGLQAGITGIQQSLAGFGLGDSSVAGLATGELAAGLTAQEIARRQGILGALAGGGATGLGLGLGAQQLASGLAGRQAQTIANIGAVQGAERRALFGIPLQIGTTALGFGLGGGFGGFAGQQAGQRFQQQNFGQGLGLNPQGFRR